MPTSNGMRTHTGFLEKNKVEGYGSRRASCYGTGLLPERNQLATCS